MGLADALVRALTAGHALVVSVELSSLSSQVEAPTTVDMLANLLFGDAAAAVIISPNSAGCGPEIVAAGRSLWPESLDQLGVRSIVHSRRGRQAAFLRTPPEHRTGAHPLARLLGERAHYVAGA